MRIENRSVRWECGKDRCYVHARGLMMPCGFGIITMQKLDISGCDVFSGIETVLTHDGGKSFSPPKLCKHLARRYFADGSSVVMSDATPFYHKKSGKIILTGHTVVYGSDNKILKDPRPRSTAYAVYDGESGDFGEWKSIEMPDEAAYFSAGAGCSQILETESGELLIPIYYRSYEKCAGGDACSDAAVMRCSFDGESIRVIEIGHALSIDVPRGFDEPSIIKHKDEYFLTLRNDVTGFVTKSSDGLHFEDARELCFEDGASLGNYNTQQHWLTGGGRLWLVYTRRAGVNDHIFRHRAPLFIAEFDPERMCVSRSTEQIAVAERGARLGNFGCQSYSESEGYIYAAEWMQNDPHGWDACAKYGSDNSIFINRVIFEE